MNNEQIIQAYSLNILPVTNKGVRANVYELTSYDKPKHLACIPMDYRFNSIITCAIREIEMRTSLTFLNWYYVTPDQRTVIIVFKAI